ncbi:MAG: hypothetical protein KF851_19070 [Pirellulaceae bacterium]|nr:hypothetical protein [Pirellulaceae bacterium]MBX3419704.1 hypothetical protein [Pirellulaceae bacterium]
MGRPLRAEQFAAEEICIVHAIQRCVRRAFLAGIDAQTGTDYSYRREWIRRRMEALASVFGIDVLTYAILSNHLHVILRNRPDVVAAWTDEEVALRWLRVFPGRRLDEHLADPTEVEVQALASNPERITKIRQRLSDISWFMRALSEPIARLANRQDDCTGRFWEGRFKAQRIADEAGLLACAMYVDLNPIRAAMVETPDQAVHTSAYDRIEGEKGSEIDSAAFDLIPVSLEERVEEIRTKTTAQRKEKVKASRSRKRSRRVRRDSWLAPLTLNRRTLSSNPELSKSGVRASDKGFLNLAWQDYLELLRWTAVQGADFAQRKVPKKLGDVLRSVGIEASMWRDLVWNYKKYFGRSGCAGSPAAMNADAARHNRSWYQGHRQASECFASS